MICKNCRKEIREEDSYDEKTNLCLGCFDIYLTNNSAQEIIPFLLKYNIDFTKVDWGSLNGFSLEINDNIFINFFYNGRVEFEYKK